MNAKLQAVRGMNDILPDEAERWEALEVRLREWLNQYGYRNIRLPIVERSELFQRAIGEATDIVEKEMYSFEDSLNQERLTLRPEATASVARMAIEHSLLYGGPQRFYYSGPMFRHERPQKGRYRQFHQIGVEALGYEGPDIDAEQLVMCHRLWEALGLDGLRLELNSLGSAAERRRHRESLVGYFREHEESLDKDSLRRLTANPLRILDSKNPAMEEIIAGAPIITDYIGVESQRHLDGIQKVLSNLSIPYTINPRLVRGLDYYNLTVFEWISDKLGAQGTVCGGGRYDGLFEQLGGKPTPACGWAMGMERLIALAGSSMKTTCNPQIYLVNVGENAKKFAFRIAEILRDYGFSVAQHHGGGGFKQQMRKADASGALLAVIIGDDEAASNIITIKPLREQGSQCQAGIESIAAACASLMKVSNSKGADAHEHI